MASLKKYAALGGAAIIAPAGHGKTELLAQISSLNRRTLVLTHTHAGVHVLKQRIKRLGIDSRAVNVVTIAGWCARYAYAFPEASAVLSCNPTTAAEWDQLNRGVELAIQVPAIRDVVKNSYDQILIDEYQDCVPLQHKLAVTLSKIVPTLIFGDPMQGIFEFAGATLSWDAEIQTDFQKVCELSTAHRWKKGNVKLGLWISETREKLIAGEEIDLHDSRIVFKQSNDVFDMSLLFQNLDNMEGSVATIHCRKGLCKAISKASNGGYQAIEENAGYSLKQLAVRWDSAANNDERIDAIRFIFNECAKVIELKPAETESEEVNRVMADINRIAENFDCPEKALKIISLWRYVPQWKIYRGELYRDSQRAFQELIYGRVDSLVAAADRVRQHSSLMGRRLPKRTISTPLLLKGLEFNHVILPTAHHFQSEDLAQAKLFYVAISRATDSLTISSADRFLKFPVPNL